VHGLLQLAAALLLVGGQDLEQTRTEGLGQEIQHISVLRRMGPVGVALEDGVQTVTVVGQLVEGLELRRMLGREAAAARASSVCRFSASP
jgi:hypothetical protein